MKTSLIAHTLQLLLASTVHYGVSAAARWNKLSQNNVEERYDRGGVASEAQECSDIGKSILKMGGNAVDAVVATTFCVGVVAPYHSGIGGGGFMLVRAPNGTYEAIDFRESVPSQVDPSYYNGRPGGTVFGGPAVAVPGEVRGLHHAHQKYGKLGWAVVMKGAIRVAEDGFILNSDFMTYIDRAVRGKNSNFLVEDPSWAEDFADYGHLKQVGDTITRKRYAKTLAAIAEEGPDAFYNGSITREMVKTLHKKGAVIQNSDFSHYKIETREVFNDTIGNFRLFTFGAPSSGAVALQIVKVANRFNDKYSRGADDWHYFTEAMRFGYAARGKLGDPYFDPNITAFEMAMLDDNTTENIVDRIERYRTLPVEDYGPEGVYAVENHGTSHISTADSDGYAVSLTTTVNLLFGSQIMCDKTGVVFNNEMDDFSLPGVKNEFGFQPSPYNYILPRKRPMSSIANFIVENEDGTFYAVVGAAGGSRIISATASVLSRMLTDTPGGDLMGIKEAVAAPRLHDQLMPNRLLVETSFNGNVVAELRKRGHAIEYMPPGLSIVEGVMQHRSGTFEVGSDPRQSNHGGARV
ncbi:gamma-glutamyltranspeptidase [Dactylonectria estremocensis]|uniref:Glutathione hydrolase n=1 Tax=Dactylonectria estremocensis TaxID=1079267 RepID=A0A9P9ECR0_9HYPO|nr:gamma-glutamyltranspeptidase [Dactylonectria estremocensis]